MLVFSHLCFCVAVQSHSFIRKWLCWGFSSSGEKSFLPSRYLFTVSLGFWRVWKFLSGVWSRAILSKDLFWNNSAESPAGGFGLQAATWRSLRDWEGNSDRIILKNYSPSPARYCPLILSCQSDCWAHGEVSLLWVCMREYNFRNILIISPSASRIILGVSSALNCNCAGVEVLALGIGVGFFLCLHTQGEQKSINTFNSPLKGLQG